MLPLLLAAAAFASYTESCTFAATITDVEVLSTPAPASYRLTAVYLGRLDGDRVLPDVGPGSTPPAGVLPLSPSPGKGCAGWSGYPVSFVAGPSSPPTPGTVVAVHFRYRDGMTPMGVSVSASWSVGRVLAAPDGAR